MASGSSSVSRRGLAATGSGQLVSTAWSQVCSPRLIGCDLALSMLAHGPRQRVVFGLVGMNAAAASVALCTAIEREPLADHHIGGVSILPPAYDRVLHDVRWGRVVNSLRVDPVVLHMTADHMEMYRADHETAHAGANAQIEESSSGWVGRSAAALLAKASDWADQSAYITERLALVRDGFDKCGYRYTDADDEGAADLFRAMRPSEDHGGNT